MAFYSKIISVLPGPSKSFNLGNLVNKKFLCSSSIAEIESEETAEIDNIIEGLGGHSIVYKRLVKS